jgi:hypothetical protein
MRPPVRSTPQSPNLLVHSSVMSPTNITGYIHQFHITDEYIVTFVGTDEQVNLNSLELRMSINR